MLHYLLWYPDSRELLKVTADFAGQMDRDADGQRVYAQLKGCGLLVLPAKAALLRCEELITLAEKAELPVLLVR